jgi:predicted Rossmann fold nucleotide-binding protein DprA/Smf involved in DNA uptake
VTRGFHRKIIPPGIPLTRRQKKAAGEAIVSLLGRVPGSISEVAEHLGLDEKVTEQLLQDLVRRGRVQQKPGGIFTLHDPLSKWWESRDSC